MRLQFTKMQGAGNDFVVLNALQRPLDLSAEQFRKLADRRFGVGADQFLIVGPPADPAHDFSYRIVNADGGEVEHCGNGARCFVRYVREKGLTTKSSVLVEVSFGVIELTEAADGHVTVQIAVPRFAPADIPFRPEGLATRTQGESTLYALPVADHTRWVAVANLGNPHAVQVVADADSAPVAIDGPLIEAHAAFPARVNAGFMQIVNEQHIRLRVFERGVGETLACGTGAVAAVVCGIEQGLLKSPVTVDARGGRLAVRWAGKGEMAYLSGPAVTVFEGEIDV
ncbi:diaminopimelate epimerase [beta proteobacterium AAP99]|nr:diaminopimelate epimerase [beta proteobacterium AAP99]